jgi:Xaa-Pro aminopeptidase
MDGCLEKDLIARHGRLKAEMEANGADAMLLACVANMIYATGRVVNGFFYIAPDGAAPTLFVKKPLGLGAEAFDGIMDVEYVTKPESMPAALERAGRGLPRRMLFEDEQLSYSEGARIAKAFAGTELLPGSAPLRRVRSVKTEYELKMHRISGEGISAAFGRIPKLYRAGMTDIQLSIEMEAELRRLGDMALIRSFGRYLEIPPGGSLLAGDNAIAAGPYEFAIGGAGLDRTAPIGANGGRLKEGQCLLVDFGGNFSGYLIDMSRTFSIGDAPEEALRAHAAALEVQAMAAREAKPGAICGEIYGKAMSMVAGSGFAEYFMGFAQQSKFIGHGVGLELNELPVIALNSKTELEAGMVIAIEPKFTLPGIGAVGTENTFVVTESGLEALTFGSDGITRLPPPA